MVALLIVFAGFCIIFGARGLAQQALRTVAGFVIVLSFLPGVLVRCEGLLAHAGHRTRLGVPPLVLILLALSILGLVAWRTRAYRERRRQEKYKRSGSPRERVAPASPVERVEEES